MPTQPTRSRREEDRGCLGRRPAGYPTERDDGPDYGRCQQGHAHPRQVCRPEEHPPCSRPGTGAAEMHADQERGDREAEHPQRPSQIVEHRVVEVEQGGHTLAHTGEREQGQADPDGRRPSSRRGTAVAVAKARRAAGSAIRATGLVGTTVCIASLLLVCVRPPRGPVCRSRSVPAAPSEAHRRPADRHHRPPGAR